MTHLLRVVTIHPLFVHLTIGLVPLMILAYIVARAMDSERWAFVADATLYLAAAVTIPTAAFGIISYVTLDWPGGVSPWSWLHLTFGIASAVMLLGFAGYRFGHRKHHPIGGRVTIGASLAIGAVVAVTGWIGGEVLVYHAGMAVEAAGNGALAPSNAVHNPSELPHVDNLIESMHELRGSWAAIVTREAHMVVDHPEDATFDEIARHARRISQLSDWIVRRADEKHEHPADHAAPSAFSMRATGSPPAPADDADQNAVHTAALGSAMRTEADAVAKAATARDLPATVAATGRLEATCAECHVKTRWHNRD